MIAAAPTARHRTAGVQVRLSPRTDRGPMDDDSRFQLFDPSGAHALAVAHRPADCSAVTAVVSDAVWLEDPGYHMTRQALETAGARIVPERALVDLAGGLVASRGVDANGAALDILGLCCEVCGDVLPGSDHVICFHSAAKR